MVALLATLLVCLGGGFAYADKPLLRTRSASGAKPPRPSPHALRAARLGVGDMKAAGQLLAGRAEAHWVRAAGGERPLPGTLRFPVDGGHAVRVFGSGAGGYHQAIDIGGQVGANVRAAASGLVAYADDDINGYGNLIILVHPGGVITTYAHNQKNLVEAGQRVQRGAIIALLGSTGRSKGPHVHFELLFGGRNCDPVPLFRPKLKRKNGEPVTTQMATWKVAEKRPKSVKCAPRKHHPDYGKKPAVMADDDEESAALAPP